MSSIPRDGPADAQETVDSPPAEKRASARPAHREAEQIGPFRIVEKVGEGGMGVVYKAEQREPVRRVVALKIIKLGMDTKEVVARFEAERQALAMLAHPNVAKVFEAGMTDNGRPYFAMEYVAGVPLTVYCDDSKLATRQRLELFIAICQAVQHAHQKGIIHRDLKPTNILVTLIDGKPAAKVIDFGIAKATNQALTQHTLFTQTGALIGTPEYMSPEQAMTGGLDVDTRTDIYSLGVILYELLTGSLPIDPKALRSAGLEQMARLIKTIEPQRPSTRLTSRRGGTDSATGAAAAPTRNSRLLQKELKGDLDWVVLKAMEKERSRRYESASALALDLQRHLDHEPVVARPPSTIYRVRKFVRKHRVGVAAAIVVTATLLAGVATSTALYLKSLANETKAASALAELRSTAPTYIAQAKSLFADQKSNEALAAIEFALRLDAGNADYHLLRAHKLQALARLPEAIEAYRKVLAIRPTDASAQSNLQLCQTLDKTRSPSGELASTNSIALVSALIAQNRSEDLWPLQRTVGRDAEANRALILSRTRGLASLSGWTEGRITPLNDGTFRVNLTSLATTDLSWVAGLPISEIQLDLSRVTDIAPLSGLPLRKVSMDWTAVRDLEPLRGKPITDLQLNMTSVSDLSPLAGMPLERLALGLCNDVENLGPLAGLPLRELRLSKCLKVRDFSPLARCTQLERLVLPSGFQDVALLRKLPSLQKVLLDDTTSNFDWTSVPSITSFLPMLEQRLAQNAARLKELRADLIRLGMSEDKAALVGVSASGEMNLDLFEFPLADLAFLKGLPIRELSLLAPTNQFSDLSPLAEMPLWNLGINGSRITSLEGLRNCPVTIVRVTNSRTLKDISAIKGKKLDNVAFDNTGVEDIGALVGCATLRLLYLGSTRVADLSALADCTGLTELSLYGCPVSDISPLAKSVSLKELHLENTRIDDLRGIGNANLHVLAISGTKVSSFAPLANMTEMEHLLAYGTPIRDLAPLAKLTSMIHLDVENSPAENLPVIPGSKLRILKIGGTRITDVAPLKNFTELEDLSATGLPIADLSVLSDCKKLHMLYIGKIPATDVRPICDLPLNTLYMDGSKIADVSPLANCKTLEHLILPREAKGVEALRNHPRLQRMSYSWDEKAFRVSQTVKEFWAEHDRK